MSPVSNDIVKCPECGCSDFLQKLVLKTGVRIVNGQAVFNRPFSTPAVRYFMCENCGAILPGSVTKVVTPLPSDHEVRN